MVSITIGVDRIEPDAMSSGVYVSPISDSIVASVQLLAEDGIYTISTADPTRFDALVGVLEAAAEKLRRAYQAQDIEAMSEE